jgi:hypothetical protein
MKVAAFVVSPNCDVIGKILRHCGLRQLCSPPGHRILIRICNEPMELPYVNEGTFSAMF